MMANLNIFDILQFFVMAAAAVLVWSLRQAFASGRFVSRFEDAEKRLLAAERRLDRAGAEMSDLATRWQAWPEHLRDEFISRREWGAVIEASAHDRASLHREIDRLWETIRLLRPSA